MNEEIGTQKIAVGERVKFSVVLEKPAFTRFGETSIFYFADSEGKVIRKCFAQGGLKNFLDSHTEAKSVCLKQKLEDGEYTINVWTE